MKMEAVDKSKYIIIGKYWISKMFLMSRPTQLYVTNTEINECKLYRSHQLFNLLKREKLDTEPLNEYFDEMARITREQRIDMESKYDDWLKTFEERKLMSLEDK
jgi:hypothetical protein